MLHHVSLRTAHIHRAIAFYELLGFSVAERFTAGITLACWLSGWGSRLELLQVPEPAPPPDPFGDEGYVGYYHLSLDVGPTGLSLPEWLDETRSRFAQAAADRPTEVEPLRMLLEPQQQAIGAQIYEVAFLADTDGLPIEVLRAIGTNPSLLPS